MKIAIIDDEPLAISSLRRMIETIPATAIVGSARSAASAMHLCEARQPDLVLLDIEMPQMDGMTLARELKQAGNPLVIFITAYDRFAIDAFDVEAIDYVLKPVDPDRLRGAIERARSRLSLRPLMQAVESAALRLHSAAPHPPETPEQPVYWANVGGRTIRIPIADIRHVEACRDYAFIHTGRDRHMVRETMARLETAFEGTALQRIHRSHIVNLDRIQAVSRDTGLRLVTLDSGEEIPVGRRFYGRLVDAIDIAASS